MRRCNTCALLIGCFAFVSLSLAEQAPPNPTPYSSRWHCFSVTDTDDETDPHPRVEALGIKGLAAGHVCVIERACVTPPYGEITMFSDEADATERSFDFPRSRPRDDGLLRTVAKNLTVIHPNSTMYRTNVAAQRFFPETSVLLRPSRCCGSVLDTFDTMPTLQAGMRKIRFDPALREAVGLNANIMVPVVMFASGAPRQGDLTEWTEWMVRFALQGRDDDGGAKVAVGQVLDLESGAIGMGEPVCFARLLIASAPQHIFPSKHTAFRFRDDVYKRLSQDKKKLGPVPERDWFRTHEKNGVFVKPQDRTVVLVVRNPPLRGADDHSELSTILQSVVGPVRANIRGIDCRGHSPLSQAVHGQIADMFVSFRGSDLVNIIFMRPNRLVVELNAVFGHDRTVRQMATMLGLKHAVWTCTRPSCAFGGDRSQWDRFKATARFAYDDHTGRITVPGMDPFVWPPTAEADDACPLCVRISSSDAFRATAVAHSAVAIRAVGEELRDFFQRCMPRLGWIELEVAPRFHAGTGKPLLPPPPPPPPVAGAWDRRDPDEPAVDPPSVDGKQD